jgi:hypothetical protein
VVDQDAKKATVFYLDEQVLIGGVQWHQVLNQWVVTNAVINVVNESFLLFLRVGVDCVIGGRGGSRRLEDVDKAGSLWQTNNGTKCKLCVDRRGIQ